MVHVHTHLTIFVNGKQQVIPYGIGIPGFQAVDIARPALRRDRKLLLLAARARRRRHHPHRVAEHVDDIYHLGQFFDEWGQPLSTDQVGPAKGKVTVFFTSPGKKAALYTGDPNNLPLGDHYQIQLDVGTPIVAPYQVKNWGGL